MRIKLVGFTGEPRGLEGRLAEMAPLVVLEGETVESSVMIAPGLDWDPPSLREASTGDDRYMQFVHAPVYLAERETILIAGSRFFKLVRACMSTTDEAPRIGAWKTLPGGFRWSRGSRRAFAELADSIANKVAPALHRALFDPLEKSHGEARDLFNLFEASGGAATTPDRALDRALFFFEMRDLHGYEWLREQSVVIDGLFSTEDEFEAQFAERRQWLSTQRWSEMATHATPSLPKPPLPSLPLYDDLIRRRAELMQFLLEHDRPSNR